MSFAPLSFVLPGGARAGFGDNVFHCRGIPSFPHYPNRGAEENLCLARQSWRCFCRGRPPEGAVVPGKSPFTHITQAVSY